MAAAHVAAEPAAAAAVEDEEEEEEIPAFSEKDKVGLLVTMKKIYSVI